MSFHYRSLGQQADSHLDSLTSQNATKATVEPLLQQVVDIVGAAVSDIKKLVGSPVAVILASVDGTVQVTVQDVAQLLANILTVSDFDILFRLRLIFP